MVRRNEDKLLTQDEAIALIAAANKRLKSAGVKVRLVLQGRDKRWISIQATLPPKPGTGREKRYQQKMALGKRAMTSKDIDDAVLQAKAIDLDLNRGTFSWQKFSNFEEPSEKTIADWVVEFERGWWRSHDKKNPSHASTWRTNYQSVIVKLPLNQPLTEEVMKRWLQSAIEEPVGKRRHHQYVSITKALLELADMDDRWIKKIKIASSDEPQIIRNLPSDEEIEQMRESISDEGWKYVFSLLAAYGLRPHEVFFLDRSKFPVLRTHSRTKTGERSVMPVPPEWGEWCREEVPMPIKGYDNLEASYDALTTPIRKFFQKQFGRKPYDLRHAFAQRLIRFEVGTTAAAKLMGHSEEQNEHTYRRWASEQIYLDIVDEAIKRKRQE